MYHNKNHWNIWIFFGSPSSILPPSLSIAKKNWTTDCVGQFQFQTIKQVLLYGTNSWIRSPSPPPIKIAVKNWSLKCCKVYIVITRGFPGIFQPIIFSRMCLFHLSRFDWIWELSAFLFCSLNSSGGYAINRLLWMEIYLCLSYQMGALLFNAFRWCHLPHISSAWRALSLELVFPQSAFLGEREERCTLSRAFWLHSHRFWCHFPNTRTHHLRCITGPWAIILFIYFNFKLPNCVSVMEA